MLPELGVSSPAIIRNSVVLPQPDGPRKHTSLPSGTLRSTLSTACAAPKRRVTACKVRWVIGCSSKVTSCAGSAVGRAARSQCDPFVADQLFEQPDQRKIDRDDD